MGLKAANKGYFLPLGPCNNLYMRNNTEHDWSFKTLEHKTKGTMIKMTINKKAKLLFKMKILWHLIKLKLS